MAKKTKKTTYISFLLDETGSMMTIKDDTIGGFNNYVQTLKDSGNPIGFTLVKFDTNHTTTVHRAVPIEEVDKLTPETYNPGSGTNLVDAAVEIISETAKAVKDLDVNVVVVIQTDGQENSSRENTVSDLKKLVDEKSAAGWQFVFLGAGIDAFSAAASFGISRSNAMSYDRGSSDEAFTSTASNTVAYASTGSADSLRFTDEQRASAKKS